jgi:hypothetical protein
MRRERNPPKCNAARRQRVVAGPGLGHCLCRNASGAAPGIDVGLARLASLDLIFPGVREPCSPWRFHRPLCKRAGAGRRAGAKPSSCCDPHHAGWRLAL